MPKSQDDDEFVDNMEEQAAPKPKKKKKKKKKPATNASDGAPEKSNSSRPPRNEVALVEYDEEKAAQSKPKRQPPPQAAPRAAPRKPPREEPEDNVSAVSDEEYEPDPDDEPRFKYSTAELADGSWRNSKCCLITVALICIILAIVLSIVMVRVFEDKDAENQAKPPTMAPTTAAQASQPGLGLFALSQSAIEDRRCTASNENSNGCQTACDGFECCDPTLAQNSSCFFYNEEGCLNYQRCHVTSSGVVVPPFNLAEICSPARISSDSTACQNACASVACCWQSDVTCYDKFYTCLDYAECQNLRPTVTVPVATFEVADFCDSTQAGSLTQTSACEDACKPAECCWSDDPSTNCLRSDFLSCMTYSPCGKLELPGAGEEVALPPSTIRSDCSITLINTGNAAPCLAACSAGSCCMEGAADDCFASDPLACLAYEPCVALLGV